MRSRVRVGGEEGRSAHLAPGDMRTQKAQCPSSSESKRNRCRAGQLSSQVDFLLKVLEPEVHWDDMLVVVLGVCSSSSPSSATYSLCNLGS